MRELARMCWIDLRRPFIAAGVWLLRVGLRVYLAKAGARAAR